MLVSIMHVADKRQWRIVARTRRARAALAQPDAGAQLAQQFCTHAPLTRAVQCVAGYMPKDQELDVRPLLEALAHKHIALALPKVVDGCMGFFAWRLGGGLRQGAFGISEPTGGDIVHPDIVLLPLLGFTRAGARLGYGGGHYDSWFARSPRPHPLAIGVGYGMQEFDVLPQEPYDITLQAICTPDEFITLAPKRAPKSKGKE